MTPATRAPTYADVTGFQPLLRAFGRTRRAKRGRGGEPAFYRHLEENLLGLSAALDARTYRPDPYRTFVVRHTKERVVSEATFRDRVVHHSLVAAMEPVFEAGFIGHSYACRKAKGTHAAIARARRLSRVFPYFLKLDVEKYFAHVDHETLLGLLAARVEDDGVLWLCRTLLAATGGRRGLPIGNLTSQFWANVYLDSLDHHVRDTLCEGTYLRYMDDMLVFGDDKPRLWEVQAAIRAFVDERLGLCLKDRVTRVAPVTDGIPWLGMRVFPGTTRLDQDGRRRFGRKLRASMARAAEGPAAEAREVACAASLVGHVAHADTWGLRRRTLAEIEASR